MIKNKENSNILEKIDHSDGMTVPAGYFADFAKRMEAQIPERVVVATPPAVRSFWQRIRPYAYMAAMFAGIWCMMNMVDLLKPDSAQPSSLLAEAFSDDNFMNEYYLDNSYDEEFLDNLYEAGYSPSDICEFN
ncbi:MAG: hypothetical protein HDT08_02435 [Bacteroidales bacterium]|nr:hypothetical protein [Bacteroidales bacterium]MBD5241050.1 hypothetical protein [Barnesiella sp.]